jgi:hypothetical protein
VGGLVIVYDGGKCRDQIHVSLKGSVYVEFERRWKVFRGQPVKGAIVA